MLKKWLKKHNKDIIYHIIFIVFYLIIIALITHKRKYILGSTTDFAMQHYFIPEYFRTLFYKTHNLFPSFAPHLSGGENIYYLSYYGLLNPIILISYLFPKVSMLDYIMISMSFVVLISTSLLYFYLRKNKYNEKTSFLCAFMFLCSAPLIFHSHRHIMFIDYFPFLLLGFFGIDIFTEKKNSFLLILSIALMIFTSYYFSISGMITLGLLGIYKYLKQQSSFSWQDFIHYIVSLILRFIPPIFISSILTIPTFYTIITGRASNNSFFNIKELLKPNLYLLYSHYSMGLTIISLIAILYAILKKEKANKFLGIILLIISISPPIAFILNGFLYASPKAMIPFIPLVLLLTAEFIKIILTKIKHKRLLVTYICISSISVCIFANFHDVLIPREKIKNDFTKNYKEYLNKIPKENKMYRINSSFIDKSFTNRVGNTKDYKTTSYSSTYNKRYSNSYNHFFENPLDTRNKFIIKSSRNILFEMYMGEKYIYTKETLKEPYKKINSKNGINLYENSYVYPVGYATTEIINTKDFKKLSYPENVINILGRGVRKEKTNTTIKKIKPITLDYKIEKKEKISIKKHKNEIIINSKEKGNLKLKLKDTIDKKILFIGFELKDNYKCLNEDQVIKINGIKNVLTCKKWKYYNNNSHFKYTIINPNKTLNIKFTKGIYHIKNIKTSVIDIEKIKHNETDIYPLIINKSKTAGDNIVGKIKAKKDSYFVLSIPYDKGFQVKVDNKNTNIEKTNKAFIGFPLTKGTHNIKITYKAPYHNIGFIGSTIGIISMFVLTIIEIYLKKSKKEIKK